jgi:hypothetical protein
MTDFIDSPTSMSTREELCEHRGGLSDLTNTTLSQQKSFTLLTQRGIIEHARYVLRNSGRVTNLIEGLHTVQTLIFDLDRFGETVWNIDVSTGDAYLSRISEAAGMLRDLPEFSAGLSLIREYGLIELSMRNGEHLTRWGLLDFYVKKCCDVRMHRSIITSFVHDALDEDMTNGWLLYDVAGEVLDDVEDLIEDEGSFNGNRFAESLRIYGIGETLEEYIEFLEALRVNSIATSRNFQRGHARGFWQERLVSKTLSTIDTTLRLIRTTDGQCRRTGALHS